MKNSRTISEEQAGIMTGLKFKSYQEYLAARCLFHNNYLEQAATLSNTCIEKQLKAALIGQNVKIKRSHDTPQLLNDIKSVLPKISAQLNVNYLNRLKRIYDSRYFGADSRGLNYAISRNFYLAELDYSFSLLNPASKLIRPGETKEQLASDLSANEQDEALYKNNYILQRISKLEIFDGQDYILATVVLPNYEVYSVIFNRPANEFFNNFSRDGIRVDGNTLSAIVP